MTMPIECPTTISNRKSPLLRWLSCLLIAMGTLSLLYVAFAYLDASLYQAAQSHAFQQEVNALKPSIASDPNPESSSLQPAREIPSRAMREISRAVTPSHSPLGQIEISAIGLSAMIQEGTDSRTLRRAVGHIPGTPLPGEKGNVAITGHRDTFFRPLRNIRINDEITLTTSSGCYRYRVISTAVVEPDDMESLSDSPDAVLTLVTCFPFYYVGPAPKRFIVRAHIIPI